ncbi:MAG: lipopolysaccharide assembly protein LapA domain-containing protein [Chitinophagales bacterium]
MNKVINTIRAITIVALVALVLVFCFLNLQNVAVNFIFVKAVEIPLFIVLFSALVIGTFLGFLIGLFVNRKRKSAEKATKKESENQDTPAIDEPKNDLIA